VIDLHLHTTASDGRSAPDALVREAAAAGVHTLAVTDHDTVAGLAEATAAAHRAGLTIVPGIEVTAVDAGRDVHILGYFFDPAHPDLVSFLSDQRADRRRRIIEMLEKLADIGAPVELPALPAGEGSGRALGRPLLARALVEAGYARNVQDAFDQFLAHGRPAFVERRGASPAEVVALLARAGGVASVAHPGKQRLEATVRALAGDGLAAVEVFHPDHDGQDVERYLQIAKECDLLVTGGSDHHGPGSGREAALGRVGLPAEDFDRLVAHAARLRRS
jgi:3',5'-nucleoside bisphosphate phosphatase